MATLELFMLGFLAMVVVVGVGWIILDSREDSEK